MTWAINLIAWVFHAGLPICRYHATVARMDSGFTPWEGPRRTQRQVGNVTEAANADNDTTHPIYNPDR